MIIHVGFLQCFPVKGLKGEDYCIFLDFSGLRTNSIIHVAEKKMTGPFSFAPLEFFLCFSVIITEKFFFLLVLPTRGCNPHVSNLLIQQSLNAKLKLYHLHLFSLILLF